MKKLHRRLAAALFIPLAWQAVTGYILYYRHAAAGQARPWKELMVKLHNAEFLGGAVYFVGLAYVLLLLAFVVTGAALLFGGKNGLERQ